MRNYKEEYHYWLNSSNLSEEERRELYSIKNNKEEIESRFFEPLKFGTAGLRGTMKLGLHHMNVHVIRHVTQAFANVISAEGDDAKNKGVVIAYDSRLNGTEYAREAASVIAANGIHVRIFDAIRPTPELSFAVLHYGCAAGLNITASHNPKDYNGYKVYWSDGAQLPPKYADAIAKQMEQIDIFTEFKSYQFDKAMASGLIEWIGEETDEAFLKATLGMAIDTETVKKVSDDFKIVFTPFHGCGHKLVPAALKRIGIKYLYSVPEQMVIDGNFPTVISPNPENPEGYSLAIQLAEQMGGNLIIGTDPDSDRVGIMVRQGVDYEFISGNQVGVLLLDYIIQAKKRAKTLPENAGVLASIVTTMMARVICEANGIHFEETFTGFKFMAERVSRWNTTRSYSYILAFEESHGYMMGDHVRDKDAISASVLIAEMAAYYHLKGMTLLDALEILYERYGYYAEHTVNLMMPGLDGITRMKKIMDNLRSNPPLQIAGEKILRLRDYLDGSITIAGSGKADKTPFSGSNVLYFELADGSSYIIRPSGTEPKIKVYMLVCGKSQRDCAVKIQKYNKFTETISEFGSKTTQKDCQ